MLFAGMCYLGMGGVSPLHNTPFTFNLILCCDNQWPHKALDIFLPCQEVSLIFCQSYCHLHHPHTTQWEFLAAPEIGALMKTTSRLHLNEAISADNIFDTSAPETIRKCWPQLMGSKVLPVELAIQKDFDVFIRSQIIHHYLKTVLFMMIINPKLVLM